jgi:hypothetical protein
VAAITAGLILVVFAHAAMSEPVWVWWLQHRRISSASRSSRKLINANRSVPVAV